MPSQRPTSHRLFLALWPSTVVTEALVRQAQAWQWPPSARRTSPERLHLTLHFIGNVPAERLDELRLGLAVPFAPFDLELVQPEIWPGGIAVLCAQHTPEALRELHAALARQLLALGLPVEDRPFRPHLTFARKARGAVPPKENAPLMWRVFEGYRLMRSVPGDGGYQPVFDYRA